MKKYYLQHPVLTKSGMTFLAGAAMATSMPPWCFWPALFAGFGLFYYILSTTTKIKAAFGYGWLFGFGYFVAGLSWIGNALLVEGSQYSLFWPLAVAGLPAFLALFTACAAAITVKCSSLKTIGGYLLFTSMMMIFEWLRGHIFTGFPWNLYGYAWSNTLPMAQIASLGGIYWLSLATCMWATLPGFLLLWPAKRFIKIILVTALTLDMSLAYLYGMIRLHANPTTFQEDTIIRLVQPNIAQKDKWNPEKRNENLEKTLLLSEPMPLNDTLKTLIIWPETMISTDTTRDTFSRTAIKNVLGQYRNFVYLLSGTIRRDSYDYNQYYNSMIMYDRNLNPIYTHDKTHLVPFGEYIPLQKYIPLTPVTNFSGFTSGHGINTMHIPVLSKYVSALVCYEIIFPGRIIDEHNRPDLIVNVTNDGWYGDSAGPRQHFSHAIFRTIEEGIPMIRSANTGISGIIDPVGRIIHKIPLNTAAGINISLPQNLKNAPLYSTQKDRLFFITLGIFLLIFFVNQLYKKYYIK